VKLIGRIDFVGQAQYRVFKGEERPWIDVELDVQIDWPPTAVFGVQINLPGLAK
jgi:hypothetical protein